MLHSCMSSRPVLYLEGSTMFSELLSIPAFISCVIILGMLIFVFGGKPQRTPPGPRGLPVVGYAPFLGNYAWKSMAELKAKYGNIVSVYLGPDLAIILQDYEAIRAAFIDQEDTFAGRGDSFVMKYLSTGNDGKIHGIIALEGAKWQATHNFVVQTLKELGVGQAKVENMILEEIDRLAHAFRQYKGTSFDPKWILYPATASIVGMVTFGRRFAYEGDEFRALTKRIDQMFDALAGGPLNSFPWLRLIPGPIRQKWEGAQYSLGQQWNLFERELHSHEETFSESKVRDFIDAYLIHVAGKDNKDPLAFADTDDLVTTLITMFSAGPEATHVHMLWSILLLCHNPGIQKKIRDEIDTIVGFERPVTLKDKDNLPLTTAALFECLRLGGVNPLGVPRCNVRETELLGYNIPARTLIIPNMWAAHRDPKYFPDPMVFNPQRFLDSEGKLKVPEQFILFSIGKRTCPGKSLAEMMVYLMFTNIFQRFEFRQAKGEKLPGLEEWLPGISANTMRYKIEAIPRTVTQNAPGTIQIT